jgi:chorismate lyase/3-hydroxybenzoate synthase
LTAITLNQLSPVYRSEADLLGLLPEQRALAWLIHEPDVSPLAVLAGLPGAALSMPPIGSGPALEAWLTAAPVVYGETGAIRHASAGPWLMGVGNWPAEDIADATRQAYRDIIGLIGAREAGQLVRVWNYFPDINRIQNGLERYRSFCLGRHDALREAGLTLTEDLPAASAVGAREGRLWIVFLAGRGRITQVENPRQVSAFRYPPEYGPRSPSFSRAVRFLAPGEDSLFISGTASILGHRTVHPGDPVAQCRTTLDHLQTLLTRTGAGRLNDIGRRAVWKVYLRHPADYAAVSQCLREAMDPDSPILYVQGDICRADLLLEIEGFVKLGDNAP